MCASAFKGVRPVHEVGHNLTFIGIYGVHTVFSAGKSPCIRPYAVQMYGSGQPYLYMVPHNNIPFAPFFHASVTHRFRLFQIPHTAPTTHTHTHVNCTRPEGSPLHHRANLHFVSQDARTPTPTPLGFSTPGWEALRCIHRANLHFVSQNALTPTSTPTPLGFLTPGWGACKAVPGG